MAKKPPNHRANWTLQEVRCLAKLADQNTPPRVIALKMGRTAAAVQQRASEESISLRPTNQSPYNRGK